MRSSRLGSCHSFLSLTVLAGIPAAPILAVPVGAGSCDPAELVSLVGRDFDTMGTSVAIDGDIAATGAPFHDGTTDIDVGRVDVFVREGAGWSAAHTLMAPDPRPEARLGSSVAVAGDLVAAGAAWDDEVAFKGGAVYLWRRAGDNWVFEAKLVPPDGVNADQFGTSVAAHGDVVIVGADWEDDAGSNAGAVYVFRRTAGVWNFEDKLIAPDGGDFDLLGTSVATDGVQIVAGATRYDGVVADSGAAYTWAWDGAAWVFEARLDADALTLPADLGAAVAVHGDVIVVGAPAQSEAAITAGAVYAFERGDNGWRLADVITAPDAAGDDRFGTAVAMSVDTLVVGAMRDDDSGGESGSVSVLHLDSGAWTFQQKLLGRDGALGDRFGRAVGLAGTTALVGAPFHDEPADNGGAAYAFELPIHAACDCNANGQLDWVDTRAGVSDDCNSDDVPDECACAADADGDGVTGFADLLAVLSAWGNCSRCPADYDGDGTVGLGDVLTALCAWGPCP